MDAEELLSRQFFERFFQIHQSHDFFCLGDKKRIIACAFNIVDVINPNRVIFRAALKQHNIFILLFALSFSCGSDSGYERRRYCFNALLRLEEIARTQWV